VSTATPGAGVDAGAGAGAGVGAGVGAGAGVEDPKAPKRKRGHIVGSFE
jgi:hypothetical protein